MHTGTANNLKGPIEEYRVKLMKMDSKEIAKVKMKPDVIFHLGMYSSTNMYREDNNRINEVVEGAVNIFRFAAETGATVVYASSSSVYNGQKPPYKESMHPKVMDFYTEGRYYVERLAELYHSFYKVNSIGLRLFSVYGRHEENKKGYANLVTQFLWALKKGESPVIFGDGTQTRDFTYVDDVVDAFVKASQLKGFDIFNVGTGKCYTINDMVKKLKEQMNTKIEPKYVKNEMKNYVMETLADTSKAEKGLGFKARYTLDTGISDLLDYYGR